MKVVVSGYAAGFPVAGLFWHAASFALGFRAAGHDVWYLEDSGDHPWGWDVDAGDFDHECRHGARFLAREMDAVGMGDRWVYRHAPTDRFDGMDRATTMDVLADAEVLVNVSLSLTMRPEYRRVPHRFAIDTDPVFTQIRVQSSYKHFAQVPETHTRLFTFGRPPLPAQRDEWVPCRQPVPRGEWPVLPPPDAAAPFTTVASWQAYPPSRWQEVRYGVKDVTLRTFAHLPAAAPAPMAIALSGVHGAREGVELLAAGGWQLPDPADATRSTAAYRAFIAGSLGEIGFAKHGYVAARSGWFSERSCSYLAAGRPVVAQDTGWSDWLPTGDGLFAFNDDAGAVAAMEEIVADPARHAAAARKVAEEHFDGAKVCTALLEAGL
ncbi:MAG: hypothetical protein ACRDJP_13475 [Actinomycetota bacterium]